jgi:hypothetical protein
VVRTREKFVAGDPESSEDRFDLAHARMELAMLYRKAGMCPAAEQAMQKAQAVFEAQQRKYSLAELENIPACRGAGPRPGYSPVP